MYRYSKILGIPVFRYNSAVRTGNVKDVVFIAGEKRIGNIIVCNRGLTKGAGYIVFDDIRSIGLDALIIRQECKIKRVSGTRQENLCNANGRLMMAGVLTRDGINIGTVQDILFDEKNGKIEGLEVSNGLLQDLISGRNIIPFFGNFEFGDEYVLVSREACEETLHDGGGLKNILNNSSNTVKGGDIHER